MQFDTNICQGGKVVGSWISIQATRARLPPGYLPRKKFQKKIKNKIKTSKPLSVPFMISNRKAYLKKIVVPFIFQCGILVQKQK